MLCVGAAELRRRYPGPASPQWLVTVYFTSTDTAGASWRNSVCPWSSLSTLPAGDEPADLELELEAARRDLMSALWLSNCSQFLEH